MEPEISLPSLQETVTGTYHEPDESSPHLPIYFPNINFNIIFPSTPMSSKWSLTFKFFNQNIIRIF